MINKREDNTLKDLLNLKINNSKTIAIPAVIYKFLYLLKGYTEVVDYSLRGLAYPAPSYSCMHEEKLHTAVEEIFYCSQEVTLTPSRHSG
jgi:hypothetical protein